MGFRLHADVSRCESNHALRADRGRDCCGHRHPCRRPRHLHHRARDAARAGCLAAPDRLRVAGNHARYRAAARRRRRVVALDRHRHGVGGVAARISRPADAAMADAAAAGDSDLSRRLCLCRPVRAAGPRPSRARGLVSRNRRGARASQSSFAARRDHRDRARALSLCLSFGANHVPVSERGVH